MPITRDVSVKAVFAQSANTTIPLTPTSGTPYRNTSVSEAEIKNGWPFKTVVDSANFNEIMYELSKICKLMEQFGVLPWASLTDYDVGSFCLGSDGKLYQALIASGPSSAVKDPTQNPTYWNQYGSDNVTKGTAQTITGDKAFSGAVALNGSVSGGSTAKETIVNWSMPSNTYESVTLENGTYTAPADGYFQMSVNIQDRIGYAYCGVEANGLYSKQWGNEYTTDNFRFFIPVKKGDVVSYGISRGSWDYVRFIYAKGEA